MNFGFIVSFVWYCYSEPFLKMFNFISATTKSTTSSASLYDDIPDKDGSIKVQLKTGNGESKSSHTCKRKPEEDINHTKSTRLKCLSKKHVWL